MTTVDCIVSMVLYENPPEVVAAAVRSLLDTVISLQLWACDNSRSEVLRPVVESAGGIYRHCPGNPGYGRANNLILRESPPSKYFLIANPDVIARPGTIRRLIGFMDSRPDAAIVIPRVLNRDGSLQPLNKRNPTVLDLFLRRFLPRPFVPFFKARMDRYEMRDVGYTNVCEVPAISGAFMFCRRSALQEIGGFDPRYFLYFEDADLSRTLQARGYKTLYYPDATITHLWQRAPHKDARMALTLAINGIRYFRKWGWQLW